ncbi:MAG: hypothetical protein QXT19_05130 [Candidatus Woesearchaeota archaeon]
MKKMLGIIKEMSKLQATTDLSEMGIAISEAKKQVAEAKLELANAKSKINSINLNCASSDIRVFISVDKNQIGSAEKGLGDVGAYLDAVGVFVDSGQRFTKVTAAVESNRIDEAIEHVRGARQLNSEAKQQFSRLASSDLIEIATTSVALKNRLVIMEEAYNQFEEGLIAAKSGNERRALELIEEVNAKFAAFAVIASQKP